MPDGQSMVHATLLRPDDLLSLEITGVNLRLDLTDPAKPVLVAADPQAAAYLVVGFPPQTTFEEAFHDASPDGYTQDGVTVLPPPPGAKLPLEPGGLAFRLGGPSRLSFRLPAGARIPYTIHGLLEWSGYELVVPPVADVPANGEPTPAARTIREPTAEETTLQLPFRLHLAPTHAAAWQHARAPITWRGRSELWHTRLAGLDPEGRPRPVDEQNTIGLRAVWSPDYRPGQPMPDPAETGIGALAPMGVADRHQIVILTSAFDGYANDGFTKFVPQPVQASLVMLSALGGWLRSFGAWDSAGEDPAAAAGACRHHRRRDAQRDHRARPCGRSSAGRRAARRRRPVGGRGATRAGGTGVAGRAGDRPGGIQPLRALEQAFDPRIFGFPIYDLDEDARLDLSQWAHVAAQGRDHYVRIVYEGKLHDCGHRASLVKVTERRFELSPSGNPVAYLRQFQYVVVKQRERLYAPDGSTPRGRGMPLRRITLTTRVTPHIDDPYINPSRINGRSFWVMVGGKDFLFHGIAEGPDGELTDFAKPMIFVPNSEKDFGTLQTAVGTVAGKGRLRALVPGQKLAFADGGSENAVFVTEALSLAPLGYTRDTFFEPRLFSAEVRIPAVEALTGASQTTTIAMLPSFVAGGFEDEGNKTEAFAQVVKLKDAAAGSVAELVENTAGVKFSAAQSGGFATPELGVAVLTRVHGPLGGKVADALSNSFRPADVFPEKLATLFGAFDLADLLPPLGKVDGEAPKMTVKRVGDTIVTTLDWMSSVGEKEMGLVAFRPNDTTLTVHVGLVKRLKDGTGSTTVTGNLSAFDIEFLELLIVRFTSFHFASRSGEKPEVKVELDDETPVKFIGDLAFVEGLRQLIPPGVFGDGVSIDLIDQPLGIRAGLEIGLPPAAVGVFALKNIAFSAGLTVPFIDGKPVVEFGFARRDAQFQLAVLIFGGGGFFHVELDTDGLRKLEAAFEFGAVAALDIGVASGEVHVMAGIYFAVEKKKVRGGGEELCALLSGYLRCGGSLCVLGIVRISVEFYLAFTYYPKPEDKAKGRATLTVEVEIACFSKSVELTVERSFGGKGGDPTFADQMTTPELWAEYAEAFA